MRMMVSIMSTHRFFLSSGMSMLPTVDPDQPQTAGEHSQSGIDDEITELVLLHDDYLTQ